MRKTYEKACQVTFVVTHKQDMLQGACGRIQERGTARAGNTEILTPLQKEALTHILHAHTQAHKATHTTTHRQCSGADAPLMARSVDLNEVVKDLASETGAQVVRTPALTRARVTECPLPLPPPTPRSHTVPRTP